MGLDLASVFSVWNILLNVLGVAIGIVFGALPGLTATMGVALFLPFTFGMQPVSAFALLLGIYCGGIYGGSVTAILIRTPGTPAAAATVLDGYPLAQQGHAFAALSGATIASFVGGVFSCLALMLLAPQLAKVALSFGPPEYFAVGLFGLSIVSSIAGDQILKGVLSGLFGLVIASIGIDPIEGSPRFTFGSITLMGGVDFVSSLIGLFAISEVLSKVETIFTEKKLDGLGRMGGSIIGAKVLVANTVNMIRSSIIGTIVGIIPATGSGMASWLSYNEAKRASKEPKKFGHGSYEGLIASETANNAVTGGALVPLLTLGIPGDVVTAIMLGALMLQGLTPGPQLFSNHPDVVFGIYAMMILANVFMLILGLIGINAFVKVLKIPTGILMPCVLALTYIGAFAINNSVFDMRVATLMGLVGYVFTKANFPVPPILLGIILGPIIETNFRRSLIMSHGDLTIFTRPICLVFIIISCVAFFWPCIRERLAARKAAAADRS